ncbi:MAG: peptidylprolyl isomerase [Gammaproteobacteria bacterium]|nr:peptidylprolyl isomerase [Gammaproteobacteria bacterium]
MNISATIETSKGPININLFPEKAPVTVASFINLANKKYYDGLNFHRVIGQFMIQGGCPTGTGTGGPGYQFEDEFDPSLIHDAPGKLSMANAGPGTNGSQFFITHVPTPHLDGMHSIFGEVNSSADQDVVNAVEQGDEIVSISISGDVDELLATQASRTEEWDGAIAANFPDLA